ncbi:MAG TPA: hypothetical protein VLZ77_03925 [Acidimicrobiales bacterium]|nr:hypothetical protein [Acidimicrobiales bacterium]
MTPKTPLVSAWGTEAAGVVIPDVVEEPFMTGMAETPSRTP